MPPRSQLPARVRDHPAVTAACHARDLGRLFRTINNLTEGPARFTAAHIGILCQMPTAHVQDYMRGNHATPSLDTLIRVADGLRIPGQRFALAARPWERPTQRQITSTTEAQSSVGENIRRVRLAQDKTQAVIAGFAGIEPHHYGRIERGTRNPSINVLHNIARALETTASELLGQPQPAHNDARPATDQHAPATTPLAPAPAEPWRGTSPPPPTTPDSAAPGIGELIRTQRLKQGWSQNDLADALNTLLPSSTFTRTEISRYESEARMPTADRIYHAFAQALQTPETELRAATARSWEQRAAHRHGGPRQTAWQKQPPTTEPTPAPRPGTTDTNQPNHLIRAHRLARGWTQQQAADAVTQALADATGKPLPSTIDAQWIGRLERGERRWPNTDYRAALRAVYGTTTDAELGLSGARFLPSSRTDVRAWMSDNEDDGPTLPMPDHGTHAGEEDMKRRELLGSLVGLGLAPPALSALDNTRRAVESILSSAPSQNAGIEYAELAAERYSYGYHGQQPLALLADLAGDFSDMRPLLADIRTAPARARTCRASAQLAGMIGIVLHDLGRRREAHGWFHTASLAAQETGDRELKAWILAREAMVPLNFGAPQAAADLATQARAAAGKRPTASAALACAVASRAYALLGQGDQAREALSRAESVADQLSPTAAADTWFGYPEQKHHVHASQALTHLGDTHRAYASQRRALELSRSPRSMSAALIHLDRAACLHQDGETDEACALAHHTITALPAEYRTDLVISRARDLIRAVPEDRRSAASELDELIRSIT